MNKTFPLLILMLLGTFTLFGQKSFTDTIFNKDIQSVQLYRYGFNISYPIITLGSGEQLTLAFDEFGTKGNYYSYTVIHCNADWRASDYLKSEYVEPYTNEQITEITYSNNTLKDYVHYEVSFPNNNVKILKSGNYILSVYADNENEPVLTRKFYVVEPTSVPISVNIKQATDLSEKLKKQELDIIVGKSSITNTSNVKLFIQQNGRTDNMISLRPSSSNSDELIYDYDKENVFEGGSEFRDFDIKSVRYKLDHVEALETRDNGNHAFLFADKNRGHQAYESGTDLNGRQYFKTEDYDNQMAAEYVWVHFFILTEPLLEPGTLYIFGELTQWKYLPEAVMTYNQRVGGYQGALMVKQGYYNYQYLFVPKNKTVGITEIMEGNHWETENDYIVYVYYRPDGAIADKLIGVKTVNTAGKK